MRPGRLFDCGMHSSSAISPHITDDAPRATSLESLDHRPPWSDNNHGEMCNNPHHPGCRQ